MSTNSLDNQSRGKIFCLACPEQKGKSPIAKFADCIQCTGCLNSWVHGGCKGRIGKIYEDGSFKRCCPKVTLEESQVEGIQRNLMSSFAKMLEKHSADMEKVIDSKVSGLVTTEQLENCREDFASRLESMETKYVTQEQLEVAIAGVSQSSCSSCGPTLDSLDSLVNDERLMCEHRDREKNSRNIIIHNLPETCEREEKNVILKLLTDCPYTVDTVNLYRLGKDKVEGRIRPVKVVFSSKQIVDWTLVHKKALTNGTRFVIKRDLTKRQREMWRKLNQQITDFKTQGIDKKIKYINNVPTLVDLDLPRSLTRDLGKRTTKRKNREEEKENQNNNKVRKTVEDGKNGKEVEENQM